jgi:uncharacterized protein YggU (UPF0235/DUF167 family)
MKHISVKVKTNSKKEIIAQKDDAHFEISVKESPERNLANKRVLEILQNIFQTTKIKFVKGHHAPSKIFEIEI